METNINLKQFNFKSENIVYEVLTQTPTKIITKASYPNGLILTFNIDCETVNIQSNWTLKVEKDGSLTPIEP